MGAFVNEIEALLRQDFDETMVATMSSAFESGVSMDAIDDFTERQRAHAFAAGLHGLTEAVLRIAEEVERLR
jgi:hypothetical protein